MATHFPKDALLNTDNSPDSEVKVSVVVPVYNCAEYLNECVESILNQTHNNLEVILVNDGSNDGSDSLCQQWQDKDPRVKYLSKPNGGAASARNLGMAVASGQYLMFVDGDDIILPEMLEELLKAGRLCKDADIIGSSLLPWDENDRCLAPLPEYTVMDGEEALVYMLEFKIDRSPCTKLYRMATLGKMRFMEGRINEDFPFLAHCYLRCRHVVYVPAGYYRYRVVSTSVTHTFNKRYFDIIANGEDLRHNIPMEHPRVAQAYNLYMHRTHIDAAFKIVRSGKHSFYRQYLKNSRRHVRKNLFKILRHHQIGRNYKIKALLAFSPLRLPI